MPTRSRSRGWTSERAAASVFGAYLVVSGVLLLTKLGSFFWFARDDWFFITDRQIDSVNDVFRPHNGHWASVAVVIFRILWALFGIRSYVPYQAVVVVMHLGVVALLRVVMRRAGVGPWLATAMAGSLALFGPGREDIIWAFQMGFTGAVLFGLAQLLIADHDGADHRRDAVALGFGALAVMSTAVGLVMVVVVGAVVLVRHGWKRAFVQTTPLAAMYGLWSLVTHPVLPTPFGRPDIATMLKWTRSGLTAEFLALGHFQAVAWLMVAVLVVGVALLLLTGSRTERGSPGAALSSRLRFVAAPIALLAGAVVFELFTAQARWWVGPNGARASRYLYITAAMTLPLLAVAAQQIAKRWRFATPLLALLVLVALPSNISAFDAPPFGPRYNDQNRELLTTVVRLPVAQKVPGDVRPLADPYVGPHLDLAFLRQAYSSGKLKPSSGPISPQRRKTIDILISFNQAAGSFSPAECTPVARASHIKGPKGTRFRWMGRGARLRVRLVQGGRPVGPWVSFKDLEGNQFTVERDGLDLVWSSVGGNGSGSLCRLG